MLARCMAQSRRAVGAVVLAWVAGPAAAVAVGDVAPALELNGPNGPVRLAAWQGKLVYLDFWASWCGPCRQSFPWMNSLQSRWAGRGLQVLGISVDKQQADADRFLADNPARFALAYDPAGDTPRRYAIKGMPTSVLIGPDGRVLWVHTGFRGEDSAALEARIDQALTAAAQKGKP